MCRQYCALCIALARAFPASVRVRVCVCSSSAVFCQLVYVRSSNADSICVVNISCFCHSHLFVVVLVVVVVVVAVAVIRGLNFLYIHAIFQSIQQTTARCTRSVHNVHMERGFAIFVSVQMLIESSVCYLRIDKRS